MARSSAPARSLPLLTICLIALNLAVYALELTGNGLEFCRTYGSVPSHWNLGSAVSSLFLHDPTTWSHIGLNMVFLAIFGTLVEGALGHLGFLALYLLAGVAGAFLHAQVASGTDPLVGASAAIFGLMAVAGVANRRLLGFALAFAGMETFLAVSGGPATVSHAAHIGGFAAGVAVAGLLRVVGSEALEAA